jgi:hypothetical protein
VTTEHDRLLAEGPQNAPEPRMAQDFGFGARAPDVPAPAQSPTPPASPKPTWLPFGRLAVPLFIAALVGLQAARSHSAGAILFAVLWAVVLGAAMFRRTRKRS